MHSLCLMMRFRPTVPPTRLSRLPRSNGACRRPQPFWLWRSARSWPRGTCSRRQRHRTTRRWYRTPARRRSRSLRRNSAKTRHGPISTRAVCAVSTIRRRSTLIRRLLHRRRPQRQRPLPMASVRMPSRRRRIPKPPHQRARRRPRRHRALLTRGRKSSDRYFQRLNRPQRAMTMFSAATPTPQPTRLPTSAPATFHSIVGRGIGITILAFSDFASS